jgi:hypothetical protein
MKNQSKSKKNFPPFDKFLKEFKIHLEEDLNTTVRIKKVIGAMDRIPLQIYEVFVNYYLIYFIDLMKNHTVMISRSPREYAHEDQIFELDPITYDIEKFKEIKLFFYQIVHEEVMNHIRSSNTDYFRLEKELILFS